MGAPAVHLGDQLLCAPEEIHDELLDPNIHLRLRKAVTPDELEELGFEFAARVVRFQIDTDGKPQVFRLTESGSEDLRRRSPKVRAGFVTGIPDRRVTSAWARVEERCRWIPGRDFPSRGTVTWTARCSSRDAPCDGRIRHSSAALAWLRTAPDPYASTAASHRPSLPRAG